MKRRSWIVGGVVLVAVVVFVLFLLRPKGQERPATVVETANKVDAHPRPKDDWQPAAVDMAIYGGGQVRTGAESSARLELLEGIVRLSADTVFTVEESKSRQGTLLTTLSLQEGRLWAHLVPGQSHEFAVETGCAVAAVRDTDFSVKVVSDGETLVSVAEGEVELTAQDQGVTVTAGEQATVETDQPPGEPEPMSDEELILWATEGEMPELAPPMRIHGDVSCRLTGPAGDLAARNPETVFDVTVETGGAETAPREARIAVETPDRGTIVLEPFGDIFGMERRFHGSIRGLPQAGGTYIFTALTADGTPIPGAEAKDVYVGGFEPDPPANVRAEVVEAGILVSWDPSPVIPGGFDPGGSPPRGFYQIEIGGEGGRPFGWSHPGESLTEMSHLIPLRRQDFGPGDRGRALEEMDDGVYTLIVTAFSWAPDGAAAGANECSAYALEEIRVVIRGGQVEVEEP